MVNKEEVIFTGQPTRVSNFDYPEKALREAVLNAFCHRDYTIPMDIKVEIYDDRIRIMSPGSIPAGLTLDAIKTGANAKRNPLIVNVLDKAGLIENYGAGIMRIFESYEGFAKQPVIEAMEDLFIITLYNMKYHINSNNHQYIKTSDYSIIIDYLSKNEFASRRNIEESLNLKKSRTGLLLQKMVEDDIIEKVGSGPSTQYTLRK